ncbi:unnamed protein product, partial [Timema podura]|nr:unnamed protein product [Timema podura]
IYWTDTQVNEVKRTGLTGGVTESIIDTGIEHPTGFAIDWVSGNMYVSSSGANTNVILAANLEGEYLTTVVSDDLFQVKSLAVDPLRGRLFWSHMSDDLHVIEMSAMDGSGRKVLVSQREDTDLISPQSLSMDLDSWRLYWVNVESGKIQYYNFNTSLVETVPLKHDRPSAAVIYNGLLYYANHEDSAIHVCNKTDGENNLILRHNTGNVLSLRIYDPQIQTGTNPCSVNKGNCSHLCLPVSHIERVCKCATGYNTDSDDPTKCVVTRLLCNHVDCLINRPGIKEFLFYSINWELKGMPLNEDNSTQVLGSISRVSMATSIDFHAGKRGSTS